MTDNNWQNYFEIRLDSNNKSKLFSDEDQSVLRDFDLALGKLSLPPEFINQVTNTLRNVAQKVSRQLEWSRERTEILVRVMVPDSETDAEHNPSWGFFIVEKHTDDLFQHIIDLFIYKEGK